MINRTVAWFNTVHRHLDAELLQLAQPHISEDECLILLSEEIIIMYTMIHDIRKQRMEFMLKGEVCGVHGTLYLVDFTGAYGDG